MLPTPSAVYVVSAAAIPVKIGVARNARRRLAELQTGAPERLKLRHTFVVDDEDAYTVESQCHQALADYRIHGEWFNVPIVSAICVGSAVAEPFVRARMRGMYYLSGQNLRVVEGYDCSPWADRALNHYALSLMGADDCDETHWGAAIRRSAGAEAVAAVRAFMRGRYPRPDFPASARVQRTDSSPALKAGVNALAAYFALTDEEWEARSALAA